jgi:CheY-specific phosphatase CheX
MSFKRKQFPKVMAAVLKRTCDYLEDEIGLHAAKSRSVVGNIDTLTLRTMTTIVGTGGPISLLIAFSFEQKLLDSLCDAATARLNIEPHERQLFLRETAAETANIILGHATEELAEEGNDVMLSPPVVLEEGRCIHRPKKAMFATIELSTELGMFDIHFVGPAELFDQKLNILSKEEGAPCIR